MIYSDDMWMWLIWAHQCQTAIPGVYIVIGSPPFCDSWSSGIERYLPSLGWQTALLTIFVSQRILFKWHFFSLTQWGLNKIAEIMQVNFDVIFWKGNFILFKISLKKIQLTTYHDWLSHSVVPNRRQASTWTKDEPNHWGTYISLGLKGLIWTHCLSGKVFFNLKKKSQYSLPKRNVFFNINTPKLVIINSNIIVSLCISFLKLKRIN